MKRIIALILVVCMCVVTLASCGFSYEKDVDDYTTFDADAFAAALLALAIADGDFTTDEEIRTQKMWDAIYESLVTGDETDSTEGTPSAPDVVNYCHYISAVIENEDGEEQTVYFVVNMDSLKPTELQLGLSSLSSIELLIADELSSIDFKDYAYTSSTTSATKFKADDLVFITYTRSYVGADEDGEEISVSETATTMPLLLTAGASEFVDGLLALTNKSVSVALEDIIVNETVDGESKQVTYSDIKVNRVVTAGTAITVTHTPYTTSETIKDVFGTSHNLKNVELNYHIYPVSYTDIAEYSAQTLINDLLADELSVELIVYYIHAMDIRYEEYEDDDAYNARVEELAAAYADGEITLATLVEDILAARLALYGGKDDEDNTVNGAESDYEAAQTVYAEYQTKLTEAQEELATAQKYADDLDSYQSARDAAKAAYEAASEDDENYQTLLDAYEQAESDLKQALEYSLNMNTYTKAVADAEVKLYGGTITNDDGEEETVVGAEELLAEKKTALDAAEANLDTAVAALLAATNEDGESVEDLMYAGYQDVVYIDLEDDYNAEIKANLAAAIYKNIVALVSIEEYPEKAVKQMYNYLIDNYEYNFYTSDDDDDDESNYTEFGTFKKYLMSKTGASTYSDAKDVVWADAKDYVAPLLAIYSVASAYDLILTDDEFEAELEEELYYSYYVGSYGDENFRHAYQLDKILDYFLESEENDGVVTYERVAYTITVESEEEETEPDAE